MQLLSKRAGVISAVIAGAAAVTAIAASGVGFAATAAPTAKSAVIVDCHGAKVRPTTFNRLCGDGNDYITGMHWVSWQGVAYGSGTEHLNSCNPSCATSHHIYTYPVLLTAWRALARPGHPGQKYFSRLTEIHSGALRRPHAAKVPLTFTWDLSPSSP